MSDNKDATASLCHAGILSVKDTPPTRIPAFFHLIEEGSVVVPPSARKQAGYVLEDKPPRFKLSTNSKGDKCEVATRVIQSKTASGDAEGLAGRSGDKNVNWSVLLGSFDKVICADVSEVWCAVMMRHDSAGKGVNFGVPNPFDFWRCDFRRADTAEKRRASHSVTPHG